MLFYLLLGQLFFGAVLSEKCKKCNSMEAFDLCINNTQLDVQEGDEVTLMCYHNLPNKTQNFTWFVGDKKYEDKNQKQDENQNQDQNPNSLVLKKILSDRNGDYSCRVDFVCCSCQSYAVTVKVNANSVIIIIVCGVAALALVIIMGVAMKIKLKRDNAQHKERMKQRVQTEQNAGQAPSPQRGY